MVVHAYKGAGGGVRQEGFEASETLSKKVLVNSLILLRGKVS